MLPLLDSCCRYLVFILATSFRMKATMNSQCLGTPVLAHLVQRSGDLCLLKHEFLDIKIGVQMCECCNIGECNLFVASLTG